MVIIVGAGIGGLALALNLERRGIAFQVLESAPVLKPLGVGINVLPHAMRVLDQLGLTEKLVAAGVETREVNFYNRFGQFIHSDPRGRFAGYEWPQVSLHRGALQKVLHDAVVERAGASAIRNGWHFLRAEQVQSTPSPVTAWFDADGQTQPIRGSVLVGCDGIRSTVRRQLVSSLGIADPLRYSGITMWRGVTRWPPFLSGATMTYAGWLSTGKFIGYPIESKLDEQGRQRVNWLCEFYVPPRDPSGDWSQPGCFEDFMPRFEEMRFDWLDVPAMVRAADHLFEYPMVDRDPLPKWTEGCMTLLGDAAHPMYPRGSNGAGQAVLDAQALADCLAQTTDWPQALQAYEDSRRPATSEVVLANRREPPDAILREVFERTGDEPFTHIDDVISKAELESLSHRYKQIAGFDRASLTTT